jgi:hypothetical protein
VVLLHRNDPVCDELPRVQQKPGREDLFPTGSLPACSASNLPISRSRRLPPSSFSGS